MSPIHSSNPCAWRCLLTIVALFFVYAPALAGGWFWDDSALITDNADLTSPHGLGSIWSFDSDWPLSGTAFWVQWHLWGQLPFGYHLVNIVLQATNAFLVWKA